MKPIVYSCLQSPLGDIWLARSEQGLCAVSFGGTTEIDFRHLVERRMKRPLVRRDAALAEERRQIKDYFAGRRRHFDLPLDLQGVTDFQRQVLMITAGIPAGQTLSYGDIARQTGRPLAARAVGNAVGANPLPLVIPCHRVLAAGGRIGGFGAGGPQVKRRLLDLEGAGHR